MGYTIELRDPVTGEVLYLDAPHAMRGGAYVNNGDRRARLNITRNYAKIFRDVLPSIPIWPENTPEIIKKTSTEQPPFCGIRTIYGLTGAESIPVLTYAIEQLGNDVSSNYWEATEGNAKQALFQLRALAQLRPDGIWLGN